MNPTPAKLCDRTDNRGRITKRGNKLMRTTLVQCTLIAIRYSGYLNSFYQKIKKRRGFGKAIIATARKLLKIIFDTLKNGWVFEDFIKFKINCLLDNHRRSIDDDV